MRIALITDGIYPFVVGGMQKHSYYLCKYLSRQFTIDLYHFRKQNIEMQLADIFPESHANINSFEVDFEDDYNFPLHYLAASRRHSYRLLNAFEKNRNVDLIICKGFTAWAFVNPKNKINLNVPLLINFHGYEMYQHAFTIREKIIQRVFRFFVRKLSLNADFCFSYGGKITEIIENNICLSKSRILEMPTGIEEQQLRNIHQIISCEKVRFCFIGRNERRKGIEELNKAILELKINSGWTFDFIGDIPHEDRIDSPNIRYHGLLKNTASINEVLDSCDVLVCPSWSEGMPNVILEAMGRGLAIAATDCGATSMLVRGDTGWIIKGNSVIDIKRILEEVINTSREDILKKKLAALNHIQENFLWEKIAIFLSERLIAIKDTYS
jgi:glycosyltransferase involved in cell wall biosynthesis